MGKRNLSWRQCSILAAACIVGGFASQSQAQINFSIPADAPDGGAGTVGILRVFSAGAVNNQDDARALLTAGGTRSTAFAPVINHSADNGGNPLGHFGNDLDNISGDNKAYLFRGNVNVVSPGTYTFNVASDDGFTLAFNGGTVPFSNVYGSDQGGPQTYNGNANGAMTYFGGRGTGDTGGQVTFASAGVYHFDLTFHDGCCGDSVELSAAKGAQTGFNSLFHLVGGTDVPQTTTYTRFTGNVSAFQVATVHGNNAGSLSDALTDLGAVLAGGAPASRGGGTPIVTLANSATINYVDPQNANDGGHGASQAYPGDTAADDNNFSTGAIATLTIPAGRGGHYTFLTYSDDSSRTRIISNATGKGVALVNTVGGTVGGVDSDGDGINDAYTNDGGCCSDILGTYNLAPGTYTIETVSNEQGGGAGHFLFGEFGDATGINPGFQLVGQGLDDTVTVEDAGSLQLVAAPEPGSIALLGLGGIAALARRRRA